MQPSTEDALWVGRLVVLVLMTYPRALTASLHLTACESLITHLAAVVALSQALTLLKGVSAGRLSSKERKTSL